MLSDEMCGICGDADGNSTNDWVTSDGTDVTDDPNKYTLIGSSWRVVRPNDTEPW